MGKLVPNRSSKHLAIVIIAMTVGIALTAWGILKKPSPPDADKNPVVQISAKKFEYLPNKLTLQEGKTVVLELSSEDRIHGFAIPELDIDVDIVPGRVTTIVITPPRAGLFSFFCTIFCGDGHENMRGFLEVI